MASAAKGSTGSAANMFSRKTRPDMAISLGPDNCSAGRGWRARKGLPPRLEKVLPWISQRPYSTWWGWV